MIEKIFRKANPNYQHRWEVYEALLRSSLTKNTVWLDVGCGKNELVKKYQGSTKSALGIDIQDAAGRMDAPFLLSDLRSIPLPSETANLITLRMVVEHLERIPADFSEITRLLASKGKLIILTTNSLSPIVFLPRLLPFHAKRWLIQKLFSVASEDVFPTYHRFNTPGTMKRGFDGMALVKLEFLEQVPLHIPLLAVLFGLWYMIVKVSVLRYFRSNILAVFEKNIDGGVD